MENQHRVAGPERAFGRDVWRARVRLRLSLALALSLYLHAFLISLELGDPGFGWPGFTLPRAGQRVRAPDLTVRLEEAPRPQEPVPPDAVAAKTPKPATLPRAGQTFEILPPVTAPAAPPAKLPSRPRRESAAPAPAARARARKPEIRAEPHPEVLARSDPQEETFNVPSPAPPEPQPPRAPELASQTQAEELPAARVAEQAEAEAEARRKEEGQRLALQKAQEAQRIEEARKQEEAETRRKTEGERRKEEEAQRLALEEARRKEEVERRKEEEQTLALQQEQEARRLALEAEALRRAEEAEARRRAEVERRKEEEAQRAAQEEAKRKAEDERRKEEARRQAEEAAARARAQDAPGTLSGKELAAKVLGQLRAPGGVPLDPPRPLSDPSRRRTISGPERDVVLRMYVEGWRSKIERNGPLNYRPMASRQARDYPVVTVSIRSDGSLEDVLIHRSSGLRELDEAVRRIARLYAPYSVFPPEVARQYDVIEIRRVWQFGDTLSIVEETR